MISRTERYNIWNGYIKRHKCSMIAPNLFIYFACTFRIYLNYNVIDVIYPTLRYIENRIVPIRYTIINRDMRKTIILFLRSFGFLLNEYRRMPSSSFLGFYNM